MGSHGLIGWILPNHPVMGLGPGTVANNGGGGDLYGYTGCDDDDDDHVKY
jgi:hypothetical protein